MRGHNYKHTQQLQIVHTIQYTLYIQYIHYTGKIYKGEIENGLLEYLFGWKDSNEINDFPFIYLTCNFPVELNKDTSQGHSWQARHILSKQRTLLASKRSWQSEKYLDNFIDRDQYWNSRTFPVFTDCFDPGNFIDGTGCRLGSFSKRELVELTVVGFVCNTPAIWVNMFGAHLELGKHDEEGMETTNTVHIIAATIFIVPKRF